jgi:hypothetical protein
MECLDMCQVEHRTVHLLPADALIKFRTRTWTCIAFEQPSESLAQGLVVVAKRCVPLP